MTQDIENRLNRIEKHIKLDFDEDEYWKDEQDSWNKEEWKMYYDEMEEEQLEREIEMAESCTCGAWYVSKKWKVIHVADCVCGNGL